MNDPLHRISASTLLRRRSRTRSGPSAAAGMSSGGSMPRSTRLCPARTRALGVDTGA
ncbi:uncharacterized protein PHACADRAFT_250590 [Phanerochaete carnosa HHB-10118-sp]|uniref:Uncharacterized protein n=1 Tax=Phanerochaete carnosa (strain HHB-10118-sp) TaxID=650164 RepID=K5XAB4_PHACS|nr:uncharacterized protein PHACADRAFT_250590 [Phanerochaete carnosa HHB-10118-sp]EKM59842.1 hypothetical protein PHACADRAFT_250590 [Phanerochaete carnosa HHB-10118-sp]